MTRSVKPCRIRSKERSTRPDTVGCSWTTGRSRQYREGTCSRSFSKASATSRELTSGTAGAVVLHAEEITADWPLVTL